MSQLFVAKDKQEFDERMLSCPFCNSERICPHDVDFTGRTIDRCRDCGMMWLNPQYSDRYLDQYYKSYIDLSSGDATAENTADNQPRDLVHQYYLSLIEERCEKGTLLSVGSGDGFEISVALQRGWTVEGYDVDPKVTSALSERLNVKMLCGDFCAAAYPANHFDCVYLHQVLEHPKNPQDYLRKIHSILKPQGVLFIASPNIGSLSSRLKTVAGKLGLKKRRGRHYDAWHHVFYYSPGVLKDILEQYYRYRVVYVGNGFGHKARRFSEQRIRREIRWNRFTPRWKDVFILMATRT